MAPAMDAAGLLHFVRDAVIECQLGRITPGSLAEILDALRSSIASVRALPGERNATLRTIGARMDGWLHSIHDPEVVSSRPLLLVRLQQIEEAAEQLAALDDWQPPAPIARSGNVIPFPLRHLRVVSTGART